MAAPPTRLPACRARPDWAAGEDASPGLWRNARAVMRGGLLVGVAWAGVSLAAPAPAAVPSYRVQVEASARALAVEATFPAASAGWLVL